MLAWYHHVKDECGIFRSLFVHVLMVSSKFASVMCGSQPRVRGQ